MKRVISIFLILVIMFSLTACSTETDASIDTVESVQPREGQCPFGIHDDPYPGKCPHYEDKNQDGICDLSF